jgi:hypothetical protein
MSQTIARATLTPVTGNQSAITVHFNPVSLQLTINNTLEEKVKGKDLKQFITKAVAKLTIDLIFDTTDRGTDVRLETGKIARFMEPGKQERDKKIPTIVKFEWGTFAFQGLIESYKETLDFFSQDGVPLRASLNLTFSRQEEVFDSSFNSGNTPPDRAVDIPSGQSASQLASLGGAPDAGRSIAAANNQDSLRFPSGAFTLDPTIKLTPPVAFASGAIGLSAGVGFSAGAGFGIGGSAGIGVSGSAGIGIGGSAGFGVSSTAGVSAGIGVFGSAGISGSAGGGIGVSSSNAFGASASAGSTGSARFSAGLNGNLSGGISAGVNGSLNSNGFSTRSPFSTQSNSFLIGSRTSAGIAATQGAFAGLRTPSPRRTFRLDTTRLLPRTATATYSTQQNAHFQLGGQASIEGSASFRTDVTETRSRIQFEEV